MPYIVLPINVAKLSYQDDLNTDQKDRVTLWYASRLPKFYYILAH